MRMNDPHSNSRFHPVFRAVNNSVFSGMNNERNALQICVIPEREQICLKIEFRFQVISLRLRLRWNDGEQWSEGSGSRNQSKHTCLRSFSPMETMG